MKKSKVAGLVVIGVPIDFPHDSDKKEKDEEENENQPIDYSKAKWAR